MNIRFSILHLVLILGANGCFYNFSYSQERGIRMIERYFNHRNQHSSMDYEVQYINKSYTSEDTVIYNAKVELIRDSLDTIFGGHILLDLDSVIIGYNGEHIIRIVPDSSLIELVDPIKYSGMYIQGNYHDNLIDYSFLKNNTTFTEFFQDTQYKVILKDSIVNNKPCLAITILLPDEEPFYNASIFVAIDTISMYVVQRKFSIYFQENEQFDEWNNTNVSFHNQVSIAALEQQNLAKYERIVNFEIDTTQKLQDFDYKTLSGKVLGEDGYIALHEIKSSFILLDFWYSSCYPCIKSIPVIEALHQHYKDKGVTVFGVNLFDDEQKSKSRLEKFVQKNPMSYKSILVDDAIKGNIVIEAYPMVVVLDHHFNVIFKDVGFSEHLYQEVSAVLDAKR